MSAQPIPPESVLEYMGRVQYNVAKAVPKLADANRQDLAGSMFSKDLTRSGSREDESYPGEGRGGVGSTYCYFGDGLWQKLTLLQTLRTE